MVRRLLEDIRGTADAVRDAAFELRQIDEAGAPPALDLDQLGAIAVLLALRWPVWVDRRAIQITFVDDATVRITTAVSFHLTAESVGTDLAPGTRIYVPLDMPKKRTLLNLRIADEDDAVLTPVNTVRNGDLAGRGLVRLFSQLLHQAGLQLPDETAHALGELAALPAAQARAHQARALDQRGVLGRWLAEGPDAVRPEVQIIDGLTQGFLQLVQIVYEPSRERRIEMQHDLPLAWPKRSRSLVALGALSRQRTFAPVSIGRARSTHVEFVAPEDMDLVSASLEGLQYDTLNDRRELLRVHARSFERSRERAALHVALLAGSEIHDATAAPAASGRALTAHEQRTQLQIEGTTDEAAATVSLLPRRSGTIPAAAIISTATAITLALFTSRLKELDGQTGAAVLLLLPAALAAYLGRPGEHRFTARALKPVRALAITSAAGGVVLSAMIAGGFLTTAPPTRPAVPVVARSPSLTAPAPAHLSSQSGSGKVVIAGASDVSLALAIMSGAIALVLDFAWLLATLLARLIPSDDELEASSAVPGHPRPDFTT